MLILIPNTLTMSPLANSRATQLSSSLEINPETKSSAISRANPFPASPTAMFTAPQANKARFNSPPSGTSGEQWAFTNSLMGLGWEKVPDPHGLTRAAPTCVEHGKT